jgi:outer membrane protein OmpA-like peptidoglycan-associated protein
MRNKRSYSAYLFALALAFGSSRLMPKFVQGAVRANESVDLVFWFGHVVAPPSAPSTSSPKPDERNVAQSEASLVSLSEGAFPLQRPTEYSGAYSTIELMDERSKTNWTSAKGSTGPQVFVFGLAERAILKTVEFDCSGISAAYTGSCAKDISVEVSDVNEISGYRMIADVSLKEGENNQKFAVGAEIAGRWVRLRVKNNHGSQDFIQLNEFRATGTRLTHTTFPDVSGTYDTELGDFHLRQQGTSVTGCYYTRGGIIEGGVEGRVIKLTWCDSCGATSRTRGPAILVFSPDAQRFIGEWWDEGNTTGNGSKWNGTKKSSEVGTCPHWTGGAEEQIANDLEQFKRSRVYGINFDSDSVQIKAESIPTLDKIASLLRKRADWKMTIEGHTDSTFTPEHNQQLSERRAQAVKNYLAAAGIAPSRLKVVGYGASKPVADNDTPLGRAQNRRVELTR